jgi:GTP-binding protein HflX
MNSTKQQEERVILVAAVKKTHDEREVLESIDELEELVETAGGCVLEKVIQKLDSISATHYIGSGKIEELKELIHHYEATGIVCDDELTPMQMKNLSDLLNTKVMDRTMVILDIFAKHSRSKEGNIQVEMAQLRYRYSRLTGYGEMLSRQGGGIGSKGAGEKKLELDKRHIRTRIEQLKQELEEIQKHRNLIRSRRDKNSIPIVAIVGYTNAGKSTLLNSLTGSEVYVKDQLFATVDPTTRAATLPSGTEIMLTDTVGFIRKLPHHLIKAFYSTLEEAKYADIILHVMDVSSPHLMTHQKVVYDTLEKLDISDIPIIAVYNKIDKVSDIYPKDQVANYEVAVSAKSKINTDTLLKTIEDIIYNNMLAFTVLIPYAKSELIAYCHENGERIEEQYENEGVFIKGYIPKKYHYKIESYLV